MDPINLPGSGPNAAAMLQAEKAKAAAQAAEDLKQKRLEAEKGTVSGAAKQKEYFMNVNGGFYVFPDGKKAVFQNGVYATDSPYEIEELEKLCNQPGQHLVTREPQEVLTTDMKLLTDVAQSTKGTPIQGAVGTHNILPR